MMEWNGHVSAKLLKHNQLETGIGLILKLLVVLSGIIFELASE